MRCTIDSLPAGSSASALYWASYVFLRGMKMFCRRWFNTFRSCRVRLFRSPVKIWDASWRSWRFYLHRFVVSAANVCSICRLSDLFLKGKGYAQIYTPGQAGYGGNLGGYALGGALTSFGGNCSQPSGWGSQYYANSTENGAASTATGPLYLTTCGFANGTRKVFGYYGYDLPKPPLGITYPNIGWPYSIPYPYFTQPAYGPVGLPYYGVPGILSYTQRQRESVAFTHNQIPVVRSAARRFTGTLGRKFSSRTHSVTEYWEDSFLLKKDTCLQQFVYKMNESSSEFNRRRRPCISTELRLL